MLRTPRSPLPGSRRGTNSPQPTRGTADQRMTWRNSNFTALVGDSKGFNPTMNADPWLLRPHHWGHHWVRTESSARNEVTRVLLLVNNQRIPQRGWDLTGPNNQKVHSTVSETEMKFFSLGKPRFKYVRHTSTEVLMQHHFRARSWGWLVKCYFFRCIFKCC